VFGYSIVCRPSVVALLPNADDVVVGTSDDVELVVANRQMVYYNLLRRGILEITHVVGFDVNPGPRQPLPTLENH
jgi:hypothetical protein